jgi:predicted dehydrogenase
MLAEESLEAIAIATIPRVQYEIVKAALKRGLHVFAEKPFALDVPQAKALTTLAKKKKITTAVDFMFPEIPPWRKVKEMLDSDEYGKLRHISTQWDFLSYDIRNHKKGWKTSSKEGGGALSFYFSHGLYYLEHFAGKIESIQSQLAYAKNSPGDAETGVDLLLRFKSGATGTAHIDCNAEGVHTHELRFQCEKALIVLKNSGSHAGGFIIEIRSGEGVRQVRLPKEHPKDDARVSAVASLAERFIASAQGKTPMRPDFADGLRTQELVDAIRAQNKKKK